MTVQLRTYREQLTALAARARQLRLSRNLTQAELARRAAVAVRTIERFEHTGNTSVQNLLRIATTLHAESGFDRLFEAPPYTSIDDALGRRTAEPRKRARRRR